MKFSDLRKNIKKDFSALKTIKLAITADWAVQMLGQAIRGYGYELGLDIQVYEATYDQIEGELLDPDSELYEFQPEYILMFPCSEKFQEKFYKTSGNARINAAENEILRIKNLCENVQHHSKAKVLICNYCEIDDGIYGSYAGNCTESLLYNLRKMNLLLGDVINSEKCSLVDINTLQSMIGRQNLVDNRLYYISKTVFSMEGLVSVAEKVCAVISVFLGKIKKCIICDLDNTLWGGIIGDDELENIQIGDLGMGKAFSDLQAWVKELSKRGIAVGICSKNNEKTAKEVFEKHPDMVLKLEDISVFMANWEDKAANIKKMQEILNIGMDSIVFIDDNPFERELVRSLLPEVTVPELPKEPTEYLAYLKQQKLFETVKISTEDKVRTRQYQEEAKRVELKSNVSNLEDYLLSLDMKAEVKAFDRFSIPRVAQLTQRSNQFNLRTKRYSEGEIESIAKDHRKYVTMAVSLKDKFGESGIIGVVILEKTSQSDWFIDTLLMSCRVLKRTVEEFVFNGIVEHAKKEGILKINGEYISTKKNTMVSGLLENYGFLEMESSVENATLWQLDISKYKGHKTFVSRG